MIGMIGWRPSPAAPRSNIQKLILHKMSVDAVPPGAGFLAGLAFLSSKEKIAAGWAAAKEWVEAAIQAVREGADPNPWRNATDEEIAGVILTKVEQRLKEQRERTR